MAKFHKPRVPITLSILKSRRDWLERESKVTGIPMSTLVERALELWEKRQTDLRDAVITGVVIDGHVVPLREPLVARLGEKQ